MYSSGHECTAVGMTVQRWECTVVEITVQSWELSQLVAKGECTVVGITVQWWELQYSGGNYSAVVGIKPAYDVCLVDCYSTHTSRPMSV